MFDFFDEDFPLTKKQEEEQRRLMAEEAEKTAEEAPADEPAEQPAAEYAAELEKIMSDAPEPSPDDISIEPIAPAEPVTDDEEDAPEPVPESVGDKIETAVESVEDTADSVTDAVESKAEDAVDAVTEAVESAVENLEVGVENAVENLSENVENPPEEVPEFNRRLADLDDLDAHLHEELKSLGEKLDNMERVVDGMEDGEISEGFDYEYDGRYYAEEETPAYRHPELHQKHTPAKAAKMPSDGEIVLSRDTLIKAGAAVAAAAVAALILGRKKKK